MSRLLLLMLIIACMIALYSQSINCPPLQDDVAEFTLVRHCQGAWGWFGTDCYGFFRPVKNLLFLILDDVAPSSPWAWHLASIFLFAVCIILAERYFRILFDNSSWSIAAAAIWALAPTQVSSVNLLSCINLFVLTGGVLGCLIAYEGARRYDPHVGPRHLLLSATCLFIALLSYESAVMTLALIVLHDAFIDRRRFSMRSTFVYYGSLALVTACYFFLRFFLKGRQVILNENMAPVSALKLSLSSGYFCMDHLMLFLWPFGKQGILGTFNFHSPAMPLTLLASWIVIALVAALAWRLRHRTSIPMFSFVWFLIAFAPLSNVFPFYNGPFADYYLILPSIGPGFALAALAKWAWEHCVRRMEAGGRLAALGLVVLLVLSAWWLAILRQTADWIPVWNSEEELLQRALEARPYAFTVRALLARLASQDNRLDEAESLARQALSQAPWHLQCYYSLSDVLKRKGSYDEALVVLQEAERIGPQNPVLPVLMGLIQEKMGLWGEAEKSYRRALSLPWDYEYSKVACIRLSHACFSSGRTAEGVDILELGAAMDPAEPAYHNDLAIGYCKMGRFSLARKHARSAEELGKPVHPEVLKVLQAASPQPDLFIKHRQK